jgi:N-acetylmuramoyl-L-alanine amidase
VLVEAGVIVHPTEEAWLAHPDVRAGIARALTDGAARCLRPGYRAGCDGPNLGLA